MRHFPRNNAIRSGNVAYTYTSSTAAVATVTSAGVVTAVAPGTATITISAAGTGTGFSAATLTTATTITVSERAPGLTSLQVSPTTATLSIGGTQQITAAVQGPRASAVTYSYGSSAPSIATATGTGSTATITAVAPGTATITATAATAQDGAFAASSITALISVTVSPNAQVAITSITKNGGTVDIANVFGQFEVNLAVQPNGQNVRSVQAFVCDQSQADSVCISGTAAAQQTFGPSGAQAATVQLYINSAEFDTPNWSTGADANTLFKNGLKKIVATVTTTGGSAPVASNNLSSVNFNNQDGWTINWTLPTNKANDAAGNTWYGGPAAAGTGSFTVVPVLYTRNRTINSVTLNPAASGACDRNIEDATRPFTATYGAQTGDSAAVAFNCRGVATSLNGHAPVVLASLDNNNAAGPTATGGAAAPAKSIFRLLTAAVAGGQEYYQSLQYRSTSIFVPADWAAPTITKLDVRGGGATSVDSGWVNGAYAFNQVVNTTTGETRYTIGDGAGVGIRSARDTRFDVCAVPSTIPTNAPVTCATPVATGGLTATVASMNLPENASNLTNQAYFLVATESDRLGNSTTSNPFTYTDANGNTVSLTDAKSVFGVDRTAPAIVAIPNEATTTDPQNPALAGVRSGIDSIFRASSNTYTSTSGDGTTSISATNARFAVRTTDERSGFYTCSAAVSCVTTSGSEFHLGTFQIVRRRNPNSPLATNDATVENIVAAPTATVVTLANVMNGTPVAAGVGARQFSINIFGDGGRAPAGVAIGSGEEGYYTFSGTLVDRAGNTTTIPSRNVAIDNDAPTVNNVILPSVYTGGATGGVTVQASDDLEVMGAEMRLGFPATSLNAGITFPRVANFAATTRTGLFQNPFAALTSNKLASPTGAGQFFAGNVNLPIPFIQDMQITQSTGLVAAPGAGVASKPDAIGVRVFDIKALAAPTGGSTPSSLASSASAFTNQAIAANQVSTNTISGAALRKNWGATEVTGGVTNPGAQIGEFVVYNAGTALNATVEFRARALTSSASQPFSKIYVVLRRHNTSDNTYGDYEYRGEATYAGSLDDGGTRYFRYTVPAAGIAAVAQGNNVSNAAFTGLDSIRAIGVDASGNALASPAAIPGTTASQNAYTAASVSAINLIPSSATAPAFGTASSFSGAAGAWFTRSNAATPAISATNVSGDSRVFIGVQGANLERTARIYFSVTRASGVTALAAGNTSVTCSSSDPSVQVVAGGLAATLITSNTVSSALNAFCDIGGVTAGGVATVTATITRTADAGAYTANALLATSSPIYVGNPTITALGTVGTLSAFADVPGNTQTPKARFATFTIGGPAFGGAGFFSTANTTMEYHINNQAGEAAGVSTTVLVNALTGGATVTITCTGGSTGAVQATRAFGYHVAGRGVSQLGFSAPRATGVDLAGGAVIGNCN
jgi:hypothetical protein